MSPEADECVVQVHKVKVQVMWSGGLYCYCVVVILSIVHTIVYCFHVDMYM